MCYGSCHYPQPFATASQQHADIGRISKTHQVATFHFVRISNPVPLRRNPLPPLLRLPERKFESRDRRLCDGVYFFSSCFYHFPAHSLLYTVSGFISVIIFAASILYRGVLLNLEFFVFPSCICARHCSKVSSTASSIIFLNM